MQQQSQAVSRSPGTPTHIEFAQSPKVRIAKYTLRIISQSIIICIGLIGRLSCFELHFYLLYEYSFSLY